MNAFERVFERIALETEVLDGGGIAHARYGRFGQQRVHTQPAEAHPPGAPPPDLWRLVYLHYHAGDEGEVQRLLRATRLPILVREREDPGLANRLEQANRGTGYYEPGWRITGFHGDAVAVHRDGLTLRTDLDELRGARLEVGAAVQVRFPKSLRYAYPGCYLAIGDAGFCRPEDGRTVRLYWTVRDADIAVTVMRRATTLLNHLQVPFQIKVMNDPARLSRRDGLVLYLQAASWEAHRDDLTRLHGRLAHQLRDEVPGFALPIGRGWSYAEEPTDVSHLSFGQHRALLAAEGLFAAHQHGERSPEARLYWIARRYKETGLDITHPYLNPA